MRKKSFCLLLAIVFLGCEEKKIDNVTIQILVPKGNQISVSINSYDVFFEKTTLAQTTLDSLGEGFMRLSILQPQFVYYEIGELRGQLYLESGYNLSIQETDGKVEISGNGSAITNYFKRIAFIEDSLIHSQEAFYFPKEKYLQQLNELEDAVESTSVDFIRNNKVSSNQISTLNKINAVKLNLFKSFYAQINNQKVIDGELEISFDIPIDSTIVSLNLFETAALLQRQFYTTYYEGYGGTGSFTEEQLLSVNEKIMSETDSIFYKEIFAVQNINSWMFDHGITPALDTILKNFQNNFPNSSYQALLEKNYTKYDSIAPGKLAPNFKGTTLDGDTISLSDLKGKIVYVDVWATWCAPCIEQFPHSIALKEKLRKNELEIEFVYMSIDRDTAKWKQYLKEGKAPKGIHILNNDSFADLYYVNFTPRYMLIDREGKIINAYAPRPSTDELAEFLEQL